MQGTLGMKLTGSHSSTMRNLRICRRILRNYSSIVPVFSSVFYWYQWMKVVTDFRALDLGLTVQWVRWRQLQGAVVQGFGDGGEQARVGLLLWLLSHTLASPPSPISVCVEEWAQRAFSHHGAEAHVPQAPLLRHQVEPDASCQNPW